MGDSLLLCSEEMLPETPEGEVQGPSNMAEIVARRQLSVDLQFMNDGDGPLAHSDPHLLSDSLVLPKLLKLEQIHHAQVSPNIFTYMQDKVTPTMRQDTVCWLFEVCAEEGYEEAIFLRCCSYIDRVLSAYVLEPNQLQLLAVVCLGVSLKYHGVAFKLDKLIYYTANSVPKSLIADWELMVLYGLKWEMATVIPSDFFPVLESMLPQSWFSEPVMQDVSTYLAMCASDANFLVYTPSTIAVSSLQVAISQIVSKEAGEEALEKFHQLTNTDKALLRSVTEKIQQKIIQAQEALAADLRQQAADIMQQQQQQAAATVTTAAPTTVTPAPIATPAPTRPVVPVVPVSPVSKLPPPPPVTTLICDSDLEDDRDEKEIAWERALL